MAHLIETATTARSKCRGCGEKIAAGALRFGEALPNPFGEGDTTHWFHPWCAAYKRPEPLLQLLAGDTPADAPGAAPTDPPGGPELPDRERIEAAARAGVDNPRLQRIDGAERAPTGRAACRHCREPIAKGAWRIPLVFYEDARFSPAGFVHVRCAAPYCETAGAGLLERVRHFGKALSAEDLAEIERELA